MAISPTAAATLRSYFSPSELLDQVEAGNISPDDLSTIMEIEVLEDSFTADEILDMIASVASTTEANIFEHIDNWIKPSSDFSEALLDSQLIDLYGVLDGTNDILSDLEATIRNEIQESNFNASQAFAGYESSLFDEITFANSQLESAVQETERTIIDDITGVINGLFDTVMGETSDILEELDPLVDVVTSTTQTVVEKTTNLTSALAEAIPEMGSIVADAVEGVGSAVTTGFGAAFDGIINSLGLNELLNFMQLLGGGMNQASDALDGFSNLDVREGSWDVPASKADVANMWLMAAPFLGTRLGLQYPNEVERLHQIAYEHSRPQLLDVATTLEYIKRNPNAQDLVLHNLTRAGYDSNKITQLISMIHQPLGLIENTIALRRGFISPDTYAEKLRILGLAPDDIDLAEKLSMQLPPIGDLIRMVVRDTFEPDVVEAGQLSDGFENFPVETAEELGISNYWAEKYWQAHWMLPSLQQGFEMLHRDKISQDELLALFKAADLAPGYWEPMQAISYRPYTRVDVRRMHALGVLDEEQVLRSYLDLGYDQEKASNLTAFTLAYNDSTKKVERVKKGT